MQGLWTKIYTQEAKTLFVSMVESINIVELALGVAVAAEKLLQKAKKYFYSVMLLGHRCPKCNGSLVMIPKGRCKCSSCGYELDPTVTFQRCLACGGTPVLRVRRYQCSKCHSDIQSMFLFDGLVFDTEYFRQKVAESRQRKRELKERVKEMLIECRSENLPMHPVDLGAIPGLIDALNSLTEGVSESLEIESRDEFNLKYYEKHIQAYIQDFPIKLEEIPPLSRESARKDLIWRFIAVIFLDHAGVIDVVQHGQEILVMKHETNREGQRVFGELEETDGIEGPLGGVEAW